MSNRTLPLAAALLLLAAPAAAPAADEPARIRGRVLKVDGDLVTIDVGREAGVRERTVFEAWLDGRAVRLPMTGETVYVPQRRVAELVIVSVDAKTADAKVLPPAGAEAAPPRLEPAALVISNPLAQARNIAPHLKGMTAEPPKTALGQPATVRVAWADDRDDLVYFDWTASGGALSHARSALPEVVWMPPLVREKPQSFKITVTAVDTAGNRASRSIDIEAGPPGTQKAVYEARRRHADHAEGFSAARDLCFDEANACYMIDPSNVRLVGRDPAWSVTLRTDEYKQDVKQLDRVVVRGGDAYFTDLYAKRAVRMRIGPKMYQEPPAIAYGSEGTGNGQFQAPVDIALDARGEVYVLDQTRACVQIFTADGAFVASIGSSGRRPGDLTKPVALDIAHDGTLYILDDDRKRVVAFRDRRYVREFEVGAKTEALADVKVDPMTGRIVVLCGSAGQLRSYSPDGALLGSFGGLGTQLAMGIFDRPTRLRFDRLGSLYVLAKEGAVIHRCDPAAGEEVARWGGIDFSGATDIAAGPAGDLAVLLSKQYLVANLDRLGWVKGLCGSEGSGPGKLKAPVAVAVDAEGNIAVLDQKQNNIQVFRPRGQPLRVIGQGGEGPGDLESPVDLSIDPSRRYLAVLEDRKAHEVKVYDLGAKPGEELRGAFPGDKEALDDAVRVAITPSGIVNVVEEGGAVKSFNVGPALTGKAAHVDAPGTNALFASAWTLAGITAPGSLAVSNLLFLFAADPKAEVVRVIDLGRQGALVTEIKDPKSTGEPAVATVDDYDRVYVWDADNGRAVELGR